MCRDFCAGIAPANNDEGAASHAFFGITSNGRQFELTNDVVVQIHGFVQTAESMCIVGHTWDR